MAIPPPLTCSRFHRYCATTLTGTKNGYCPLTRVFPFTISSACNSFHVSSFPRSDIPIIGIPLGPSSEPVPGFRRAACNGAWIFITTNLTDPLAPLGREPPCDGFNYRPVPSEVRQYSSYILTMGIRRPAYPQRRPPLGGFPVRAAFCRLHRAFDRQRLHVASQSEDQRGRFGALLPHFTHWNISSPCLAWA